MTLVELRQKVDAAFDRVLKSESPAEKDVALKEYCRLAEQLDAAEMKKYEPTYNRADIVDIILYPS